MFRKGFGKSISKNVWRHAGGSQNRAGKMHPPCSPGPASEPAGGCPMRGAIIGTLLAAGVKEPLRLSSPISAGPCPIRKTQNRRRRRPPNTNNHNFRRRFSPNYACNAKPRPSAPPLYHPTQIDSPARNQSLKLLAEDMCYSHQFYWSCSSFAICSSPQSKRWTTSHLLASKGRDVALFGRQDELPVQTAVRQAKLRRTYTP